MSEPIEIPREEEAVTPTPERSKAELFAENPDRFEDLQHCLVFVKRDPESRKLYVLNQCKDIEESFIVGGYITDALAAFRGAARMIAAKTGIVKAKPGGIMNFARNGFKK